MVREIRGVLSLANVDRSPEEVRGSWRVPIVRTEATRGAGVEELVERLRAHREHIRAAGQLAERRGRNLRNEVLAIATARMRRRLEEELDEDPEFQRLLDEVVERRLDPASAATELLEREPRPVPPRSRRPAEPPSRARRRGRAAGYAPRARAITICWTSSVPSPIVRIFASR